MAQKPLREVQAKQLFRDHWSQEYAAGKPHIRFAAVEKTTDLQALSKEHPWLLEGKVVVKVDELFGKRGKLGYVNVAENYEEACTWIGSLRGKEVTVAERTGPLNHFIIEPYVPHTAEYYLALTCEREHDVLLYSAQGGMDVEEQGESVLTIRTGLDQEPQLDALPEALRPTALGLMMLFRSLDLPYVEINPIVYEEGTPYLLDAVVRADTTAAFRQQRTWGAWEIPEGFGSLPTKEEKRIRAMDARSGSSLKFVLLNPQGRIWTMVAGGGASIIYADAITAQTDAKELANYGEWSGNPTTDEMEAYTSEILSLIAQNKREQALIIGGGIANFTDVKRTFAGVIKALQKHQKNLKHLKIFVRRAGPNDREGLKALQEACDAMKIPCVTHGAELPMTAIVAQALST